MPTVEQDRSAQVGRPPRIAIATPGRSPWSETFIAAHIERLREVVLVLTGGAPPRVVAGGAPLLREGWVGRLLDGVEGRLRGGRTVDLIRHRIAKRLTQDRVEVMLAEYGTSGAEVLEPCKALGIPLVVHFHGFDAHRPKYIDRYGGYRELFAYASALVVVSRAMEQQLLALGAPREKVVYNVYGIDVSRFTPGSPGDAPPHLVAIGRFAAKKAPQLTLRAFRKVLDACPEARLTMAGKGKLWDECVALVQELGMAHAVELPGIVTPERVAELMRNSRAFVQHSVVTPDGDHEGTPLAVLEAMACALPVIATAHAGIADVVQHGERGLLCAEHDVDAMAAHMIGCIRDPQAAARMGLAGRAYVERAHRVEDRVAGLQRILDRAARGEAQVLE
ncbi:MAG: glycosyltransferase [Flavobacteriales bacterium]|nr:glycosyltransferase [Flavobacteriales bacterium]